MNLKALAGFCQCTASPVGKSVAPKFQIIEFRQITPLPSVPVYTGVIVKKAWIYIRVCEPRMVQLQSANSHTLSRWQKRQEKRTVSSQSIFSSTYFLELLWDCAPLLTKKSLPLQSITHVSKGLLNCIFLQPYSGFQRNCCPYGVFRAPCAVPRTPVFSVFGKWNFYTYITDICHCPTFLFTSLGWL